MSNESIFIVFDVMADRSGKVIYVGCADQGCSVRVGAVFTQRYEIPRTKDDALAERPLAAPINKMDVSLTVTAIEAWRKQVDEVPAGHTAALYLTGHGLEHIGKYTYLKV